MPRVDLVDETYIVADREVLAAIVHDPQRWRRWWPDLDLTVFMDRGPAGIRWSVLGALSGSAELWLEPVGDGVVVHYYLRASAPGRGGAGARSARAAWRHGDQVRHRRALAWKRSVNALKDELEGDRRPGEPAAERPALSE